MRGMAVAGFVLGLAWVVAAASPVRPAGPPPDEAVKAAFGKQGIRITDGEAKAIRDDVRLALAEARAHGIGNSKVDFAAVEIADGAGARHLARLEHGAATSWPPSRHLCDQRPHGRSRPCASDPAASASTGSATSTDARPLERSSASCRSSGRRASIPVKISWEDIGRYESSVWGDRISDVGIWVRKDEEDPSLGPPRPLGAPRQQLPRQGPGGARLRDQDPPAPRRAHGREDAARSGWRSWGSPARPATAT